MNINKKLEGDKLTVALEGRLDSNTSRMLEDELFAIEMRENAFLTIEELYNHFAIINKWIDTYYQLFD